MSLLPKIDVSKLPGNPIREIWNRVSPLPGGKRLFSKILGETAPYTGTLQAQVEELEIGRAVVTLEPRRRLMNHLNSVHAVALINLGEMCSGTCLMFSMPGDMRGIVTHMEMEYIRKSRGKLTAICTEEPVEHRSVAYKRNVKAEIYNEAGQLCAVFNAEWDLSPKV